MLSTRSTLVQRSLLFSSSSTTTSTRHCTEYCTTENCRGHGNPVARLAAPRRWPAWPYHMQPYRSAGSGRIGSDQQQQ